MEDSGGRGGRAAGAAAGGGDGRLGVVREGGEVWQLGAELRGHGS